MEETNGSPKPYGLSPKQYGSPQQYYEYDPRDTIKMEIQQPYFTGIQLDDGKWTRDQTQVLVDTWKNQKHIILNAASSSAEHFKAWKLIAEEVNKYQPPKSLQQCKKKFRNIRYICKTAMANNNESNNKKHFPLFYADFVEIITESERLKNGRKCFTPPVEIVTGEVSDTSLEYPTNDEENSRVSQLNSYEISPRHDCTEYITPSNTSQAEKNNENSPTYIESNNNNNNNNRSSPPRTVMFSNSSESYNMYRNGHMESNSNFDGLNRKHKMTDVSIMGRGYFTNKRYRKNNDRYDSIAPGPIVKREQLLPTMAPSSQDSFVYRNFASAALTSAAKRFVSNEVTIPSRSVTSSVANHQKKSNISNSNGKESPTYTRMSIASDGINDRFIMMQERQIQVFSEMLERHEHFLLKLLEQQKEAAVEAQKRDREFMLNLVEMFVKRT